MGKNKKQGGANPIFVMFMFALGVVAIGIVIGCFFGFKGMSEMVFGN